MTLIINIEIIKECIKNKVLSKALNNSDNEVANMH